MAIGIDYLEKAKVNEAALEVGVHFSSGLELTATRRWLNGVRFDTLQFRAGML